MPHIPLSHIAVVPFPFLPLAAVLMSKSPWSLPQSKRRDIQNMNAVPAVRRSWNKGKLVGPKPPLQPKHVWAIRTRLQMQYKARDLALFNLAIDSKLRGCDVVSLKVEDIAPHGLHHCVCNARRYGASGRGMRPLLDPDHGRAPRDSRACPAVSEVDQHPDNEPADKPDPGRDVERNHHGETDEDACDGHQRHQRHAVAPFEPRMGFAKHQDARANDDEGEQRANGGHVPQNLNGHEAAHQAGADHEDDIRDPRRLPPWMERGKD